MNYERGNIVLLPFPFITSYGSQQKARPALIISDHNIHRRYDDVMLIGITSRRIDRTSTTEYLIEEPLPGFSATGLAKSLLCAANI